MVPEALAAPPLLFGTPWQPASILLVALVLLLSLVVDRIIGDPHSLYHPVALIGRFVGWWGRPAKWLIPLQRPGGVVMALLTACVFAAPFLLFEYTAPWHAYILFGPLLLKACFAWRSLEEHVSAVVDATGVGLSGGRDQLSLMVSRDTGGLTREQILSGAYESAAENLVDSIISPLFYFALFGLAGAAFYRAVNTMDAMLGYRDERVRLGWFPARLDDLLNFIPARITGAILLFYFAILGRYAAACRALRQDAKKRPGFNGGIPMALIAGGVGVCFEKPNVYRMGSGERSLEEGGRDIIRAIRAATLIFTMIAIFTLFLLGSITYR